MFIEAMHHATYSEYSHAISEKQIVLRFRAKKHDIKSCFVHFGDRVCPYNPIKLSTVEMTKVATDKHYDYFESELNAGFARVCYYFTLYDGKKSLYYYGNDLHDSVPAERNLYYQFHYLRLEDIAQVPQWAKEAIIYQIFPDSFATSNNLLQQDSSGISLKDNLHSQNRLRGNLNGILENIPYLRELGISCIYLNPIFTARSYHKYDTIDYYSIDPCFGDNETFEKLVSECHEANIRVILDGVFNHCGTGFFAFQDVLQRGEASLYKDWFFIKEFPLRIDDPPNYECFAYVKHMPKLNTGNPKARDYFLDVATYWIKEADIDGWRLDVADEVNHDFWREFRKAVKSVKKDAFIVGEIWDGTKAYLQGDQFDSLMNYGFTNACVDFFARRIINAEQFDARINSLLVRYKKNIQYAQMNLLDSHDVPRFLSLCGEDENKLKLAVLFMMTHVGIPSIYYGDEKGLTGIGADEEYRKPMIWQDDCFSKDISIFYKKLINIRKNYISAMLGDFKTLKTDIGGNFYAYSRKKGDECITVAINNGDSAYTYEFFTTNGKKTVCDILNGTVHTVCDNKASVEIAPLSGSILLE